MAASGGSSSSLGLQRGAWTVNRASTSSSTFRPVPGLAGLDVCALGEVAATLSIQTSGAPVGLQIRIDGGGLMHPDAVRFVPTGQHDSFSFTWLSTVGPFEANDHHSFDVEWRAPLGGTVTLDRATVNVLYQRGTHAC
jgi:hypothetical protein